MADTIQIAGKAVKKSTAGIAVAGAGIFGILYYRYYKNQKASADATAQANAAAQTGTGVGSSDQIDTATGFPYGSEQDAAALSAQGAYQGAYGSTFATGSPFGFTTGIPPGGTAAGQSFTNNAQWSQAAEDYLVNNTGANANTVGNALGKYITGQVVDTETQQPIIEQAIAFENYPPQAGGDGYPPSIRTAPPVTTTPPPTGTAPPPAGAPTVTVPKVVGLRAATVAIPKLKALGLNANTNPPINPVHEYSVESQTPIWGTKVARGSTVDLHLATIA